LNKKKSLNCLSIVIVFILTIQNVVGMNFTNLNDNEKLEGSFNDVNDSFDENILYYMNLGHMPGLSACIVKNNNVVWHNGYGFSNLYKQVNATGNTIYSGASISKTITATALMQLWEKGLFDLDDDVNEFLTFPLRNPYYPDVKITFRMLLSHHSSLSEGNWNSIYYLSFIGLSKEWYKEYLTPSGKFYNTQFWINASPGEKLQYSNIGYFLLEYLVEILSKQSFDEYCDNNIFKPLKMGNTSFHLSDYKKNELAKQYLWFSNFYIPLPSYEVNNYGVGGIRTSVLDLSHFLIAHMNNGVFNDKRILESDTLDLVRTIQFPNSSEETWYGYGLGWRIYVRNNTYNIGHPGVGPGIATYINYEPFQKTGIIFFTNQYPLLREFDFMPWLNILWLLYEKAYQF
jgi:CubicO group peptidase (beta-lactamase class C family)